ncbi:hypothetical protein OLX12_01090 [Corynebacterium sp. 22KM0430]|nr:hypothetical protein OLX12_01090 [Corynebacterium sp. 22KM0430]WPF69719.1 hypothetical protein OLW90_01090 [Corynebacterium sp. 21KM1197]
MRGVGKTVLLTQMGKIAQNKEWVVCQLEAERGKDLRHMIGDGLYEPLYEISQDAGPNPAKKFLRALKTMLSFKASYDTSETWNFGLDLSGATGGAANSGSLALDTKNIIRDVAAAMQEKGKGMALLIDEAQDLNEEELATLSVCAQMAASERIPFLLGLAGLPTLRKKICDAKSYAERFSFKNIERLTEEEAREAFQQPAEKVDVEWSPEALSLALHHSGQYPYFIQQFGKESWDAERNSQNTISHTAAEEGIRKGQEELDKGFFLARWDRCTPKEREYLRAMCPEGTEGIRSSMVAQKMARDLNSVAPLRANLVNKGMIFSPDHGIVSFTVPGMAAFINRQPE